MCYFHLCCFIEMVWDKNSHSVLPYRLIFLTITVSWEDYQSKRKTSLWKEQMYKPVYYKMCNIFWKRESLQMVTACWPLPEFLSTKIACFGFWCHPMFFLAQISYPSCETLQFKLWICYVSLIRETVLILLSHLCAPPLLFPTHAKELKRMKIDIKLKIEFLKSPS